MPRVVIELERTLPAPPEDAYAWLTDYDDRDAERAGALIQDRPVLEEDEDRVVLRSKVGMLGIGVTTRLHVTFPDPPHRWEAAYDGGLLDGSLATYELEAEGEDESHLRIVYDLQVPKGLGLLARATRPVTRWQLHRMWDGFTASLREDLELEG